MLKGVFMTQNQISKNITLLRHQADKLRDQGVYFQSMELFKRLSPLYKSRKNFQEYGRCLFQIGLCLRMANQNKKALKELDKAAKFFKKYKNDDRVAYTYREIGTVYLNLKKYSQAKKWFQKSVEILKKSLDKSSYGMSLARLGLTEVHFKNFTEAEKLMKKGLELAETDKDWFFQVSIKYFLGKLYFYKKDYKKSIEILEKAEKILDENKQAEIHMRRYGQIWGIMAYDHLRLGNIELAKEYYLDALEKLFTMPNDVASLIYETIQAPAFLEELRILGLK